MFNILRSVLHGLLYFIYIIAAAEVDFAVQWIYREISVRTMLIMCGVVFPREHFTKWRSVNKNLLNNSCRHQLCTFFRLHGRYPISEKLPSSWAPALFRWLKDLIGQKRGKNSYGLLLKVVDLYTLIEGAFPICVYKKLACVCMCVRARAWELSAL